MIKQNNKTTIKSSYTKFNNKVIDWENIELIKINYDAFKTGTTTAGGNQKESCFKNNIINQILQIDHQDQISLILLRVLLDPKMHVITKSIITEISTSYNWCKMQQNNNHGESDNDNYILCNKLLVNF